MKHTSDFILKTLSLALLFLFGFQYLAAWTEPTVIPPDGNVSISGGGLFEETGSVVQQGNTPGYDEDFVFGSPTLDYSGSTTHASRMLFDEGKSAFRAGYADGTYWDNASIGTYSTAFGWRSRAAGTYSFSAGYWAEALGSHAIAIGYYTDANAGSTAIGYGSDAYGQYSTALGTYAFTSSVAPGSTAVGYYAKSYGNYTVTIGKFVRNDIADSIMLGVGAVNPSAQTTDPGLFVDSNNNVGIKTSSLTAGLALDVEGSVGASQYCDENGGNCFTAMEASDGGLSNIMTGTTELIVESVSAVGQSTSTTINLGFQPKLIMATVSINNTCSPSPAHLAPHFSNESKAVTAVGWWVDGIYKGWEYYSNTTAINDYSLGLAHYYSGSPSDGARVEVTNVTATGFDLQLYVTDFWTGTCRSSKIDWIAM